MDAEKYKKYHENYMQGNSGTTFQECLILVAAIPFCTFFSLFIPSSSSKFINFTLEFGILTLPIVLSCTIFSEISHIVLITLSYIFALILLTKCNLNSLKRLLNSEVQDIRSVITNYRASINFVTVFCILAVDFTVFPKKLAKTESFGFGFMDLGVGFFIFANGVVMKHEIGYTQFLRLLKNVSVLLLLGLLRVFSVKSLNYHEHISEYGVHWNFFLTLSVCHIMSYIIVILTKNTKPGWLALFTAVTHQLLLSLGVQDWVLSDIPRDSFLLANREGFVSCLGYLSIYFAAAAVGKFIFKPDHQTYKKILSNLALLCTITWIAAAFSIEIFNVSRRLVNVGYIFWVLGLSLTILFLFETGELILLSVFTKKYPIGVVPSIFQHINTNSLFFFLFGNLLTGIINTLCQTLLVEKFLSLMIILGYMVVMCSVSFFLYEQGIILRL